MASDMNEVVAVELENDIIFGGYGPGVRLTEERVMSRYGAKRHAVRAAFAALEGRGLLIRRPNRGVEVVEYTPDEVDQLYEVRIVLETAAARSTTLPVAPDILAKLTSLAKAHEKAYLQGDLRAVFQLNQHFHQLQFSSCQNPRLESLIEEHARIAQPIRVVKYDDVAHMQTVVAQHFAIVEAMKASDTDAYVDATYRHLPASAEAYRLSHERRFVTASGG